MGLSGAFNKIDIFLVKEEAGAYVLKQIDGTTAATSAAHAALRLDETVQTTLDFNDDGTLKLALDQDVDTQAALDLLYATAWKKGAASGVTVNERIYVDGSKSYGSANTTTGQLVLFVNYGPTNTGGKSKVSAGIGLIAPKSGSWKESATATTAPAFEITTIELLYDLDIKNVLDATVLTVPATHIIEAETKHLVKFVDIAA